MPSLVIIGSYFKKKRALANGMAFAAGSAGTFVSPPLIKYLLDSYGLDGTFYILGGIVFHVSVAGMLFRPPEFYVPRYLMRQKLLRLKTTTIQPQPGNVIDITEDIKMNVTAETMISSDVTGSVMRRSCKRGECDIIVNPDVAIIVDSTFTQRGEEYTMYTMSTTISAHENWNEEGVPVSDNITLSVINTSINDGATNECDSEYNTIARNETIDRLVWRPVLCLSVGQTVLAHGRCVRVLWSLLRLVRCAGASPARRGARQGQHPCHVRRHVQVRHAQF